MEQWLQNKWKLISIRFELNGSEPASQPRSGRDYNPIRLLMPGFKAIPEHRLSPLARVELCGLTEAASVRSNCQLELAKQTSLQQIRIFFPFGRPSVRHSFPSLTRSNQPASHCLSSVRFSLPAVSQSAVIHFDARPPRRAIIDIQLQQFSLELTPGRTAMIPVHSDFCSRLASMTISSQPAQRPTEIIPD